MCLLMSIEETIICVSASAESRSKMKTVRLLYLPEGLPADVHKHISKKLKEVQKAEHPLLMETLENMCDSEKDFFNLDKLFPCVLAYLYLESVKETFDKEMKTKSQMALDDVLQEEPENLIALCLKQEANRTRSKEKLKSALRSELQMNNAFAVIAFYLYKLNIIHAAIALFDRAISVWEQNGKGQELKVVLWKYLLAGAYIKLLNKDMFTQDKLFDPDETMIRIKELLSSGMDFGKDHTVLAARCYTDLALAFSKYQLIGRPEDRRVSIDLTPKECYEEAWKLCDGNDPHVMEKYAMFIRKKATTTQSLVNAAKIFEKLLQQCPHRHVAAHQLALTYRFLWFEEEKLEQRYLYQNKVKAGKVEKAHRKSRSKRSRQRRAANAQQQKQAAQLVQRMDEDINRESTSTVDNEGAIGGQDISTEETTCMMQNDRASGGQDMSTEATANTAKTDNVGGGQDVVTKETSGNRRHDKGIIVKGQMDSSSVTQFKEVHTDTDHPEELQGTYLHTIDLQSNDNTSVDEVTDALEQGMYVNNLGNTSSLVQSEQSAKSKSGSMNNSKPDELIHRNWPRDHKEVPHHMKKTEYYDRLRAENPISKKSNVRNLDLAKHNLEKANESANKSRVLYLVDLARVNISLSDKDAAEGYFDNARKALDANSGRKSHGDIAYLYEQWALMLANEYDDEYVGSDFVSSSDLTDPESSDMAQTHKLNRIEKYFLKSIRSSIKIKLRSRVAYHRLTEMLEKPTASDKWKVLYEVYKLVGNKKNAANLLKDKDKQEPEVRELFKKECQQTGDYDKFLYLAHSILDESPTADYSLERDIVEMTLLKNRSLLDSACGEEEVRRKMFADYGEAMKLSLMKPVSEDPDGAIAGGIQPQRKTCEIQPGDDVLIFMARNDYTDTGAFAYIFKQLEQMEGVVVQ